MYVLPEERKADDVLHRDKTVTTVCINTNNAYFSVRILLEEKQISMEPDS
jgi:hypothetical protein